MFDSRSIQPRPPAAVTITLRVRQILMFPLAVALCVGIAYGLAIRSVARAGQLPPNAAEVSLAVAPSTEPQSITETLTPRMNAALAYAARRYRVSAAALLPIFAATQVAARDVGLDPLLIVAVIGIESGFNPFSESRMGAQGLMQVVPRFHKDKLPKEAGRLILFDPIANIRVGARALQEYVRDNGDVVGGLQQFAGDPDDPMQSYAEKVLAEKERLELAARHSRVDGGVAIRRMPEVQT